jgi:hypothetical protein
MAERAGGKRQRKRGGRGGRRKTNGATPGLGHNSGEVPAELIQRHYATIGTALRASKAADEIAKKKRAALSNAYKAAKTDGCPVHAMREARKLNDGDHAEAILHFKDVGRVLEVTESELPLFRDITLPPPVNAYLAGRQAGREGAPADSNPHTTGSEEFVRWGEGHTSGVDSAVESLRTGQQAS